MIRIGHILIDPDSVDTILPDNKGSLPDKDRGHQHIQIIYKSGVVKNLRSDEVGMSYDDFLNEFEKAKDKADERILAKTIVALSNMPQRNA